MIEITPDIMNNQVFVQIKNLSKSQEEKLNKGLHKSGQYNSRFIKKLFREPKTGKIYRVGGRLHQASAPGEAPAILNGELERSVDYNVRKKEMEFGEKVSYAKFLEEGTSKMGARPHLGRTVKETGETIRRIIEKELKK